MVHVFLSEGGGITQEEGRGGEFYLSERGVEADNFVGLSVNIQ